jgi:hypothetical protein
MLTLHPSLRATFLSSARGRNLLGCLNNGSDSLKGLRQMLENVLISKSQHDQTSSFKFFLPHFIIGSSLRCVMNFTIKFNHQFSAGTIKIHNVPIKRFLPQESNALEFCAPHSIPEHFFGSGWVFTHLTLKFQNMQRLTHQMTLLLHPQTLSLLEREGGAKRRVRVWP